MSVKLSSETLGQLPGNVAAPALRRSDLRAGILHFGVGNFHRAHQAVYLDDLFNAGSDHDWALVGAGVFDGEKVGRQKLEEQDWLTTVVEQDSGHMQARVTGVMIDFLMPGDAEAIIAQLADPTIRIVSLTITEGGYFIDPASGVFNPTHPDIVADAGNIKAPKTVFGIILAGLMRRRDDGIVPFTVMSCDNIPHNGRVTSDGVVGLARLIDEDLANWVSERVSFPNGMVDRITPATSDRERDLLEDRVRRRGQLAGVLRAVPAMGAGGQVHRRPPGAGKGRRPVREGCVAVRADEDPHPQWRPRHHRLSGRA